jgi:uncharacterized membrane protein YeaQ/YmgE (transglycosylase-associated protein family)
LDLIVFLIALVLSGLIVGALGRLALPGPDPMSLGQTILIGIAGSFAGGLLADLVLARGFALPISVLVATGIVYLIRRSRGGTLTDPGLRRERLPR